MHYLFLLPVMLVSILNRPNTTIVLKQTKDTVYIYTNQKKHMCDWKQDCPFDGNMYIFHSHKNPAKGDEREMYEYEKMHWDHPELTDPQITAILDKQFTNLINL